jgi:Asp-tRNA(Asn)/Glu-tRNA(Gln) amidotransferase A subunit family amidase
MMHDDDAIACLTATDAAAAMAARTLTSERLVRALLARIERREPAVQAWAWMDPDLALAQARAADASPRRSPLHGIPVGIKDVIDTADMPTGYGSPIYDGHRPVSDAACVAQLREAGAVILGKTVSTEFATRHPNKTRNPHDPSRTPGGSSSGSGAAVADCMVPLALGTQTSSSIIRPAAYCGVVGCKPSLGLINRAGLKFLSESLDTLGVLSRSVADAGLLLQVLGGLAPLPARPSSAPALRIGLCRTPWWDAAEAPARAALQAAAGRLAQAGARVSEVELPAPFAGLNDAQVAMSSHEFHRALAWERQHHPDRISASLTARLAGGAKVTRDRYEAARALTEQCMALIARTFSGVDLLLAPSVPGEAPGIESTGEPTFGLMWSQLGLPCLTLPAGRGPSGLPLGVQLIAPRQADAALLRDAAWVETVLAPVATAAVPVVSPGADSEGVRS